MWSRGIARQEFVCKYFQKGFLIVVDGRLRAAQGDKTGANRTAVEVVANNINFAGPILEPAPMGDNGYAAPNGPAARQRGWQAPRPAIPLAQR